MGRLNCAAVACALGLLVAAAVAPIDAGRTGPELSKAARRRLATYLTLGGSTRQLQNEKTLNSVNTPLGSTCNQKMTQMNISAFSVRAGLQMELCTRLSGFLAYQPPPTTAFPHGHTTRIPTPPTKAQTLPTSHVNSPPISRLRCPAAPRPKIPYPFNTSVRAIYHNKYLVSLTSTAVLPRLQRALLSRPGQPVHHHRLGLLRRHRQPLDPGRHAPAERGACS